VAVVPAVVWGRPSGLWPRYRAAHPLESRRGRAEATGRGAYPTTFPARPASRAWRNR
jgi:hypothetical protein